MSKFLFTCQWSNDLGLPTRSIPIALELKRRGHEVAFSNPLRAPRQVIEAAGLTNLRPDVDRLPTVRAPGTPQVWDLDHYACLTGHLDEPFTRKCVEAVIKLIHELDADVVVNAFNVSASIAARAVKKPLATIIQADHHPANPGFIWWKEKPDDLPSPLAVFNAILSDYGLEPIAKTSELFVGDLTLCAGTQATDPVPESERVVHIGPLFSPQSEAELPDWIEGFVEDKPLIWVYCGNPKYFFSKWADSVVVLKAVFEGLADHEARVIATSGYHDLPDELPALPANFRHEKFLPGVSLARRSTLIIHHGGHGSCMTGAFAGTPALIIPTFSERESNARRLAALGVAELLFPIEDETGEKQLSGTQLRDKVDSMLANASYARNAERLSAEMQKYSRLEKVADYIEDLA